MIFGRHDPIVAWGRNLRLDPGAVGISHNSQEPEAVLLNSH